MTFPNVLVLNYLKATKQASPELQLKAENYIALGYQRLLTFEVKDGGFSIFGSPPASIMLTAKGLLEFSDMAKVYPVDPALIERTRAWLYKLQRLDGTWSTTTTSWDAPPNAQGDPLPLTAYVTWAILESGVKDNTNVSRAIGYLRENAPRATDAYALALVANALVANDPNDPSAKAVLERLDQMKIADRDQAYWQSKMGSFVGSYGQASDIETTALVAYAFLRGRVYSNTAQAALTYLVQKKGSGGMWGSTQATILALRALVQSVIEAGDAATEATVRVSLNGRDAQPIVITKENAGVVQFVTFDDINPGAQRLAFKIEGKGSLAYQVTTNYYLPWANVPPTPEQDKMVDIQVKYDRTTLAVNDAVGVTATARLTKAGVARMTLLDLGVPPGFTVQTEDLDAAVKLKTIARYELTGRQIIIYLEQFDSKKPVTLTYHLKAKFPLRAQTPSSTTYDYYNPGATFTQAPTTLTVR